VVLDRTDHKTNVEATVGTYNADSAVTTLEYGKQIFRSEDTAGQNEQIFGKLFAAAQTTSSTTDVGYSAAEMFFSANWDASDDTSDTTIRYTAHAMTQTRLSSARSGDDTTPTDHLQLNLHCFKDQDNNGQLVWVVTSTSPTTNAQRDTLWRKGEVRLTVTRPFPNSWHMWVQ
jgi:hypothetical protein